MTSLQNSSCTPPPMSVRASHLLIKHNESRNPVSRRTGQQVIISKEEARKELQQYQVKINVKNFATLAKERSDCGSFVKGGDLGVFTKGMMQKPFEEASYALKVGEISGIIETDSGLHLIYRTE
jgi:parvulin-like peptidyl-prolyl isomerase